MNIVFALYDRFTALDAIGPYEVLSRLPGARVTFASAAGGVIRTDTGALQVVTSRLADVGQPDILLVPGGPPVSPEGMQPVVEWLRAVHPGTTWTTSVCTGSLFLGAAGILQGLPATSHWSALASLTAYGAQPTASRMVFAGKIVTAAGVSAGIDMGLTLAAKIAGDEVARTIQLGIEYNPQPPFDWDAIERDKVALGERVWKLFSESERASV